MSIAFRAEANASSSGAVASQAITIPSTVQAGDILFLVFNAYSTSSGSSTLTVTSTGSTWTQLGTTSFESATSAETNSALFYLKASAADASATVTCHTSVSLFVNATISAYSGANSWRFLDVTNTTGSATLTATMVVPSVVTTGTADWIVYALSCCNGSTGYSSCTAPSGATMREANFGSASGIAAIADSNGAVAPGTSNGGGHFTPNQTGTYTTWTIGLAGTYVPPAGRPVQARRLQAVRSRIYSSKLIRGSIAPPVTTGPPFYPFTQAVRARYLTPAPIAGSVSDGLSGPAIPGALHGAGFGSGVGSGGAPVRNPFQGPAFRQAVAPARARVPQVFSKGRAGSSPGAPVRNPVQGPAFRQAVQAVSIHFPQMHPRAGRVYSNPGGPVVNPGPGPRIYPLPGPVAGRFPQLHPRAGRAVSGGTGGPVRNPVAGPAFISRPRPVQAARPLPGRGRIWSSPGGPVQNPVPPGTGPAFFPKDWPVRIRPSLPPRGRTGSNPGGPVRNPVPGPVFTSRPHPVRAGSLPPFRGRTSFTTGIPAPVISPVPLSLPSRALQAKLVLPRRGRVWSSPGAPVRNPRPGPVFCQAVRALRAQVPLRPPAGKSLGISLGAPVSNPPPPFAYIFIGHYPVGYFDYVDTGTQEILEVIPGGGYLMAVISSRPGLTVPPEDGRWLGSPGIGDEAVLVRGPSRAEIASQQLQAARALNVELQAKARGKA